MKHAHDHAHGDGTRHAHFHEHPEDPRLNLAQDTGGRRRHRGQPHEHEHHTRQVTIPVTFMVGSLDDIGLGGFKVGWLDAEQDGRAYSLTAGAGVGSPYLEGSLHGPDGQPAVYAQADIRALASALWDALRQAQSDLAVPDGMPQDPMPVPAAGDGEER